MTKPTKFIVRLSVIKLFSIKLISINHKFLNSFLPNVVEIFIKTS